MLLLLFIDLGTVKDLIAGGSRRGDRISAMLSELIAVDMRTVPGSTSTVS